MISAGTRRRIMANSVLGTGLAFIVCGTSAHWEILHATATVLGFAVVGVSALIRPIRRW